MFGYGILYSYYTACMKQYRLLFIQLQGWSFGKWCLNMVGKLDVSHCSTSLMTGTNPESLLHNGSVLKWSYFLSKTFSLRYIVQSVMKSTSAVCYYVFAHVCWRYNNTTCTLQKCHVILIQALLPQLQTCFRVLSSLIELVAEHLSTR